MILVHMARITLMRQSGKERLIKISVDVNPLRFISRGVETRQHISSGRKVLSVMDARLGDNVLPQIVHGFLGIFKITVGNHAAGGNLHFTQKIRVFP